MYEVENIRQLVKGIDNRFDCHFEYESEEYVITQTSPLGAVSWFDSIRYDKLNRSFFDHMRQVIYTNRNGDVMKELLENNRKLEAAEERRLDSDVHNLAAEMGKPIYNALREA